MDMTVVQEWKETDMADILRRYEPKDVYNADETGLFYQCTPDRTLAIRGSDVEGRKQSKKRVTLLVGANMDGSDKLPLLMIGRTQRNIDVYLNTYTLVVGYVSIKKWLMGMFTFADYRFFFLLNF